MSVKTGKYLSKLSVTLLFLLLLIKETFPNAAFAQTSLNGLVQCTKDPECVELIKGSSTAAVAAPIAKRNDEIGILVVPTGTFIPLFHWSQGTTARAQFKAKQKYCVTYPGDKVCVPFTGGQCPVLYEVFVRHWYTVDPEPSGDGYAGTFYGKIVKSKITYIDSSGTSFIGAVLAHGWNINAFGGHLYDPNLYYQMYIGGGFQGKPPFSLTSKITRVSRVDGQPDNCGNPPPLPWKDWPQYKRDAAVQLLNDSDWKGFIARMPLVKTFRPGDTVNAPLQLL